MKASFRLTPTPSGFLHKGNALNFVLVWWQAKIHGGEIVLRIDDHDEARVRDEYLENIFETLRWLGLDWDHGPQSVEEHKKKFSQSLKKDYYKSEVIKLKNTFWCECSRKDLEGITGGYPGTCRKKGLSPELHKDVALRVNTDALNLTDDNFKDFILWRKDDFPSYQWVSLIEDRDMKVTHVIRGEDLRGSTDFQKALAHHLNWYFPPHIFHHSLITEEGEKISKSNHGSSLFDEFSDPLDFYKDVLEPFLRQQGDFFKPVRSAQELLDFRLYLFN